MTSLEAKLLARCKELRRCLIGKRTIAGYICLACDNYTNDNDKKLVHRKRCVVATADRDIAEAEARQEGGE